MADPRDLASVRQVLAARKDEIRQRYASRGVGIGKDPATGEYALVVYLEAARPIPLEADRIDGVQLLFEVTGRFEIHVDPKR
jgi:hypothetical protein